MDRPEQFSPTSSRRAKVRRQTTTVSEDPPLKSGWCSNPNLTEPSLQGGGEPACSPTGPLGSTAGPSAQGIVIAHCILLIKDVFFLSLKHGTSSIIKQFGNSRTFLLLPCRQKQQEFQ